VNPSDAVYCYFDGSYLQTAGQALNGGGAAAAAAGPVRIGSQAFGKNFVFPSGVTCQTFDQLATACQKNWSEAADLLAKGAFEGFLNGMGRADLAQVARRAAKFPDRDRGLDQFLGELPTDVLKAPKLQVEPLEINLGTIKPGTDRQLELNLSNAGGRLLYGSVTCDNTPWLSLGKAPGSQQKLFKVTGEQTIPLNVVGKNLRASSKPLEGKLVVESNGGNTVIIVKAEVPAKPFPNGVLAGAKSPRQAAEKAKANPKEAAVLFEKGAVAQWYKENGWVYPVRGPVSSGLGAVQQFFEALGLTPPPKVEVSEKSISLKGNPGGDPIRYKLEVRAQEKRPVYAHATSDQPWLEVGKPILNGRTATIPMAVSKIPDRPGETLTAKVRVMANGNQRFIIPVTLQIGGGFNFFAGAPAEGGRAAAAAAPMVVPTYARRNQGSGLHWIPAAALAACLLMVAVLELLTGESQKEGPPPDIISGTTPPPPPPRGDKFIIADPADLKDTRPRINVQYTDVKRRFGIVMTDEKDPINPLKFKRLTYHENGMNNNTCIKIDNHQYLFGNTSPSVWVRDEKTKKQQDLVELQPGRRWKSVMQWPEGIRCTQLVQIVAGEQTKLLDTCLVIYELENRSTTTRQVGIRALIDTFIGSNDGTPFLVPGLPLVDTKMDIPEKDVPDFIQALETGDPSNPGVAAQIGLKISGLELVNKVRLCRWPDEIGSEVRWDWEKDPPPCKGVRAMNDPPEQKDSCVVIYWAERRMEPGERRAMGFTYGLGRVSAPVTDKTAPGGETAPGVVKMALTSGGNYHVGGTFTVSAYIRNPQQGQKVLLRLPAGLSLVAGEPQEKPVVPQAGQNYTAVSWKVKADTLGSKHIEADLKVGDTKLLTASHDISINAKGVFDR
jgi:hypothetical protein